MQASGADPAQAIVGAAVLDISDGLAEAWFSILPTARHNGLGRRLLAQIRHTARDQQCQRIIPCRPLLPGDELTFARHHGFREYNQFQAHEVAFAHASALFAGHYRKLQERGRIPGDLHCQWLEPGDTSPHLGVLSRLLAEDFSEYARLRLERIALRGLHSSDVVFQLFRNGSLLGAALGDISADCFAVDAYLVTPGHRGSWVNIALRHHVFAGIARRYPQLRRFTFVTTPTTRDTLKLARRLDTRVTDTLHQLEWTSEDTLPCHQTS